MIVPQMDEVTTMPQIIQPQLQILQSNPLMGGLGIQQNPMQLQNDQLQQLLLQQQLQQMQQNPQAAQLQQQQLLQLVQAVKQKDMQMAMGPGTVVEFLELSSCARENLNG